nr:hypothetical protein [Tanacetum cinerariifolium]
MTFKDGIKEITFKTSYKDQERSELSSEGYDLLSSRVILSEDDYDRGCRKPSDLEDGFYRDTIKLGPKYLTGIDDEEEVTFTRFNDYNVASQSFHLFIAKKLNHVNDHPQLRGLEHIMAISVISVSSDSSEDSVRTHVGRVILFGTIPPTIPDTTPVIAPPTTQTNTTVIPTEIPIIAPTIPPSSDYTPASPDYSPASETESDPSEDPLSGHIPPLPAVSLFLSSDDDTTDTPGQPIPYGRSYLYHPNGPVHMMTARKRVGPLPVQQLAMRHSVNHSSSDSSSRHSLSDHSSPDLPSTSAGPSRKRHRVKDIGYLAYVKVGPRETRVETVTHLAMPEDIPEPTQEGAVPSPSYT